ncbi:unnamed protein product [Trichobilharzia szidati]|nr:unnamed protein product [Trichobilharzia szidati]
MRHFPDAYLSKGCDPNSSLNSEAHEILRPSVLPFTEAKPDDWLKYVTHKVELFDCQNSFVSYIKDESGMKTVSCEAHAYKESLAGQLRKRYHNSHGSN